MGFTLRGNPHYTDSIERSLELLPTCAMAGVEKGGLRGITVVKPGRLGSKVVDGESRNIAATSFFHDGQEFIDSEQVNNPIFVLHEMGHYWEGGMGSGNLKPYRYAWAMAVVKDYSHLGPNSLHRNAYLADPWEAWAELFAYHYIGARYFALPHNFDVQKFTRSNAMMDMILEKECK